MHTFRMKYELVPAVLCGNELKIIWAETCAPTNTR